VDKLFSDLLTLTEICSAFSRAKGGQISVGESSVKIASVCKTLSIEPYLQNSICKILAEKQPIFKKTIFAVSKFFSLLNVRLTFAL